MPKFEAETLRPRQNGRHFADDTFKRIFLDENTRISIKISLKFVPKGPINNIPALVQIMAWRRPGDKPLSEPMMVRSLTHICVTRPQWVNWITLTISYGRYKVGDLSAKQTTTYSVDILLPLSSVDAYKRKERHDVLQTNWEVRSIGLQITPRNINTCQWHAVVAISWSLHLYSSNCV